MSSFYSIPPQHKPGTPGWLEENLSVARNILLVPEKLSKLDSQTTYKLQGLVEKSLEQICDEGSPISPDLKSLLEKLSEGDQKVNELARLILQENPVEIELPDEILLRILSKLNNPSQMAGISRNWQRVSADTTLVDQQLESMVDFLEEAGLVASLQDHHCIQVEGKLGKPHVKSLGKLFPRLNELKGHLKIRVKGFADSSSRRDFYKLLQKVDCPIETLDLSLIPLHKDGKHRAQLNKVLQGNASLKSLNLSYTILAGHFKHLAKSLLDHPSLQRLDLQGNALGDKDLNLLAQTLFSLPELTHLSIPENASRSEGLLAISKALGNLQSLRHLAMDLPKVPASSESLVQFSEFLNVSPQLYYLELNLRPREDKDLLPVMEAIKDNPNIKQLHLTGLGGKLCFHKLVDNLRLDRPDLKITRA